jgi:hypothetical protein
VKAVVTGSPVFQKHLFASGHAASATCPHCDSGEDENEIHAYWRCPAWAHIRRRFFQQPSVTVDHLPAVTQHCGLLTVPPSDLEAMRGLYPAGSLPAGPAFEADRHDDSWSYGRRAVATDGSCTGMKLARRLRRAGYGFAWGEGHPQNQASPLPGPWQSSQRAELSAALHATQIEQTRPLLIRTDSAWVVSGALLILAGYPVPGGSPGIYGGGGLLCCGPAPPWPRCRFRK